MSTACFQSRKENTLFHLNFECISENKYSLCLFISVEIDEDIRCDKK